MNEPNSPGNAGMAAGTRRMQALGVLAEVLDRCNLRYPRYELSAYWAKVVTGAAERVLGSGWVGLGLALSVQISL